jgi:hypothetical protein
MRDKKSLLIVDDDIAHRTIRLMNLKTSILDIISRSLEKSQKNGSKNRAKSAKSSAGSHAADSGESPGKEVARLLVDKLNGTVHFPKDKMKR